MKLHPKTRTLVEDILEKIRTELDKEKEGIIIMSIYTHSIAANIVEAFEQILDKYDIVVPSPEDDQREPGNEAKLYGSVYSGLADSIEDVLIETCERVKAGEEVIIGVFE